jgi:DNA-directed RNA polymerase sigma subunit (sigma70/sigma32)
VSKLSIRATLTLRNEKMVAARERMGLNQKQAAELAEVGIEKLRSLEKLNYDIGRDSRQIADRIALALDIAPEDVMPDELRGRQFQSVFVRTSDMDLKQLPQPVEPKRLQFVGDVENLKERIQQLLYTLTYREREILKLRFGLNEEQQSYTIEEVGRIFKVTRERVRQVEAKAIRKLQHPVRAAKLEPFLDQRG